MPFDPLQPHSPVPPEPVPPLGNNFSAPGVPKILKVQGSGGNQTVAAIIGGLGCFLPFFFIGYAIFNGLFAADVFPNSIHGTFTDGTIIPAGEQKGKIHMILDDSFYYIQEVSTPGRHSVGVESLFNKTYTYVYDGITKQVIERTKQMFGSRPPKYTVFTIGNQVWDVGVNVSGGGPDLRVYDFDQNKEVMNLDTFTKKFPELKSGIMNMYYRNDEHFYRSIQIKTFDGQNFEYYPEFDHLTNTQSDFGSWLIENRFDEMAKETTGWVLDGSDRKELYLVSGPRYNVLMAVKYQRKDEGSDYYFDEAYADHFGEGQKADDVVAERKADGMVFLKGEIFYQDQDYVLIIHQLDARDLSPKLVSLVHRDGKVLWTLQQDSLLRGMRTNLDDSFTSMFFIKDDLSAERVQNSIVIKMKEVGMMGIDIESGKVLWTFEPGRGLF